MQLSAQHNSFAGASCQAIRERDPKASRITQPSVYRISPKTSVFEAVAIRSLISTKLVSGKLVRGACRTVRTPAQVWNRDGDARIKMYWMPRSTRSLHSAKWWASISLWILLRSAIPYGHFTTIHWATASRREVAPMLPTVIYPCGSTA